MAVISRFLALVLLSTFLAACGTKQDESGGTPGLGTSGGTLEDNLFVMPAAASTGLVAVENIPAGTYKLAEIRSISRPQETQATVVFVHQMAAVGVINRDNDKVFSFTQLDGLDFKNKVYDLAFSVQLPLTLEASGSGLDFGARHWYWQRYDHEYNHHESWHYEESALDLSNRAYTSDIDLEESFVLRGNFENGIYVNYQKLAFEGFGVMGEAGSKAAVKVEADGLSLFLEYVVDPTYYSNHVKINQLARLYYKKQ